MKSEILARTELLFLSEIAALLFVSIFIGAVFWVLRPGSKQTYEKLSQLPLDDGTGAPAAEGAQL